MNEQVAANLPLQRWTGDRGTYHLVNLTGEAAKVITTHAALRRMEFGRQRGFGSVKVIARIGATSWKTSVFPITVEDTLKRSEKQWTLLISKKVMRQESLAPDEPVSFVLELL